MSEWKVLDSDCDEDSYDIDTGKDRLRMVTDDYQMACDLCDAANEHTDFARVQELAAKYIRLQSAIMGAEPGTPEFIATEGQLIERVRTLKL